MHNGLNTLYSALLQPQKINIPYLGYSLMAVLFTWLLHEFTHWVTSEGLGYDSVLRLNSVYALKGQQPTVVHKLLISVSGPVITVLQAFIVFLWLRFSKWKMHVYPFLLTPLYMRFMAGFMNSIKPNDEGKVSEFLGLGLYNLSIFVCILLFIWVYSISKRYILSWKFNGGSLLLILLFSSALILFDQFFKLQFL